MRYVYTLKAQQHGLGREGDEVSGGQSLKYLQVHRYCVEDHDEKAPKSQADENASKPKPRASALAKPAQSGAVSNPMKI